MRRIDRTLLVISIVTGLISIGIFLKILFVSSDLLKESIKKCSSFIESLN